MSLSSFTPVKKTTVTATESINITASYENTLAVLWCGDGCGFPTFYSAPISLTDDAGNTYTLFSEANGEENNIDFISQLWISQNIKGGSLTLTFHGATVHNVTGPAIIVFEVETPYYYQIFACGLNNNPTFGGTNIGPINSVDQNSTEDAPITFAALANNGPPGGTSSSSVNILTFSMDAVSVTEEFATSAIVAVALMNQFFDVFLIVGNYNISGTPTSPYFSVTSPIVLYATALQSDLFECAGLAYADYPYINGPLIANCGDTPNGTVGISYSDSIVVDGGTSPYTLTIIAGEFPPGLSLDSTTGAITGTPTAAGKFTFTVQIEDSTFTIITIVCTISICPPSGSSSGVNVLYYSRH